MKLIDYLPEFVAELKAQMIDDQKRWGDTWKKRPREGQEQRAFSRYFDYYDQWANAGTPIPWLKVVGEALICWVRERYPDYMMRDE